MVAVFFVTGFLSAGLAAPLVGAWADQQWVIYHLFFARTFIDNQLVQWPEETMSRFLHHIHPRLRMYRHTIHANSLYWSHPRRVFHLHPLLRIRILAYLFRQCHRLAFSRSFHHHGSCDPHQWDRSNSSRSRQQPTGRIHSQLLGSIHGKRTLADARLVYYCSPLARELWKPKCSRSRRSSIQKTW